ncbi:MAG: DUF192 domain-containing protein [Deltaproteobacteria bacterium]|nr:DUF192 domain-containing protein [Deltaproteobacteria bacterium]
MVCGAAWLVLAAGACDRTAAEPTSHGQTNGGSTQGPAAPGTTATATSDPPPSLEGRCVRPTPKAPTRPEPPRGPAPGCPADPTGRLHLPWGKVVFPAAGTTVAVEVARSFDERARGLMFRTELPEDEGMIFLFGQRRDHSFWMKNTCLPLDMLFIDQDGLIVGIEENVPTLNEGSYRVGCPSALVLEVNAGWSRRHGVSAGQRVQIGGV